MMKWLLTSGIQQRLMYHPVKLREKIQNESKSKVTWPPPEKVNGPLMFAKSYTKWNEVCLDSNKLPKTLNWQDESYLYKANW